MTAPPLFVGVAWAIGRAATSWTAGTLSVVALGNVVAFFAKRSEHAQATARIVPQASSSVGGTFRANARAFAVPLVAAGVVMGAYWFAAALMKDRQASREAESSREGIRRDIAERRDGWAEPCHWLIDYDSDTHKFGAERERLREQCRGALAELVDGVVEGPFLHWWRKAPDPEPVAQEPLSSAPAYARLQKAGLQEEPCALLDVLGRHRSVAALEAVLPTFRAAATKCVEKEKAYSVRRSKTPVPGSLMALEDREVDWCATGLLVDDALRKRELAKGKRGWACRRAAWHASRPALPPALPDVEAVAEAIARRLAVNEATPSPEALCSDDAARVGVALPGELKVRFDVSVDGAVTGVAVSEDTLHDEPTTACMVKALATWSFPRPTSRAELTLVLRLEDPDAPRAP
jgi:hypothetical protein